jgi:hypothetical protein
MYPRLPAQGASRARYFPLTRAPAADTRNRGSFTMRPMREGSFANR